MEKEMSRNVTSVELPKSIHQQVKNLAHIQNVPVKQYIIEVLLEHFQELKQKTV